MSPFGSGGLEDHLKDVPDSSPDDDIQDDDFGLEEEPTPEDAELDNSDEGDEGSDDNKEKSGRNIENVYRELTRKNEQFQERMQRQFADAMRTLVVELRSQAPQPVKQDGNSLDTTSVADLKAMRAQVPEDKREAFDDYIMDRIIREETDKRMTQFTQTQSFEMDRRDANRAAVERYPELRDRSSEFYQNVDAELARRGKDFGKTNARAVLDVANEVAYKMGVTPTKRSTRRTVFQPASKRTSQKPVQNQEAETITDENLERIKRRLEATIPGVKFDAKRIKERHKLYSENKELFIRR